MHTDVFYLREPLFWIICFVVCRLSVDSQKESWQTFEETSGHARPERVNKWPNSMTYDDDDYYFYKPK
jgi:hypothetical protein